MAWEGKKRVKQEEAKRAIIAAWQRMPETDRRTEAQAAAFTMKVKDKYPFRCSGDRYQRVKGWLLHHLARG